MRVDARRRVARRSTACASTNASRARVGRACERGAETEFRSSPASAKLARPNTKRRALANSQHGAPAPLESLGAHSRPTNSAEHRTVDLACTNFVRVALRRRVRHRSHAPRSGWFGARCARSDRGSSPPHEFLPVAPLRRRAHRSRAPCSGWFGATCARDRRGGASSHEFLSVAPLRRRAHRSGSARARRARMSSERRDLGTSGCARAARATARDDSPLRWAPGRWSPPWPHVRKLGVRRSGVHRDERAARRVGAPGFGRPRGACAAGARLGDAAPRPCAGSGRRQRGAGRLTGRAPWMRLGLSRSTPTSAAPC